jgi:hypothetical protein
MPAGLPYFAWIDVGETVFGPEHMRWDEQVFSFDLKQDEGDPASLTLKVIRPRNVDGDAIGLLGPGRKIWCWFALDCGPGLVKFRGRLVGVPTSIFEELVTLEFVARPFDIVAQKEALAASLRVLPYYDEVVLDEERRKDPEVVLEGYTKIWHYDRETHALTVSDEITGEDGVVSFDAASDGGKVLYDGLGLTLTSGPLSSVEIVAEYNWSQGARGQVDLTDYLISNWDSSGADVMPGEIASYTFGADNWPKNGAGIGSGWQVAEASATPVYDLEVQTKTNGGGLTLEDGDSTASVRWSETKTFLPVEPPGIQYKEIVAKQEYTSTYGDGDNASLSSSWSSVRHLLPLQFTRPTMLAAYTADRGCVERVSILMVADVQNIMTEPEDGEALRVTDIKSANLSEPIDGVIPIGDVRRRSYITTARGNQSIEHLIALGRAHLMKRSRVVEISFAPKLERMSEITLRKSVFLAEPRVGEALGKVIGYSISLDGSDGRVGCEVKIGCAIGRGGLVTEVDGTPVYCSVSYVGDDYQQFTDRTILVDAFTDSSVGYQPPNATPNDDGIEFLSVLRAEDVIDLPLVVTNPPHMQEDYIIQQTFAWNNFYDARYRSEEDVEESIKARVDAVNNAMKEVETKATFKLKNMTRDFLTDYGVPVTELKVPTGYDLEAV